MNIPKILNFDNNMSALRCNENAKHTPAATNFGLKLSNPITCDTISFQGKPKLTNAQKLAKRLWEETQNLTKSEQNVFANDKSVHEEDLKDAISRSTMKRILSEEGPVQKRIERFMTSMAKGLEFLEPHGRLKSLDSAVNKTKNKKYKLRTAQDVREKMFDLHGTKYIIDSEHLDQLDRLIDRLIPWIQIGKLELIEVENKRPGILLDMPKEMRGMYDYMQIEKLRDLIKIQNEKFGGKRKVVVHLEDKEAYTKANYSGLHFTFRVIDENGAHYFEHQNLTTPEELVKRVDDTVWKPLDKKDLPPKYRPIQELISQMNEPANSSAKEEFNHYRGVVMIVERMKEEIQRAPQKQKNTVIRNQKEVIVALAKRHYKSVTDRNVAEKMIHAEIRKLNKVLDNFVKNPQAEHKFVTVEGYKLPEEFDYNNIYKMIEDCDLKAEISKRNLEKANEAKHQQKINETRKQKTSALHNNPQTHAEEILPFSKENKNLKK